MHLPATFPFELRFVISLLITVITETAVLVCFIRFFFKIGHEKLSTNRCLFAGFFASFATLPYLWFVLPAFIHSYLIEVIIGEAGVYLLEAIAYVYLLNMPFKKTFLLSASANTASIIVGLLVLPPF
jgi:hypothetical protein